MVAHRRLDRAVESHNGRGRCNCSWASERTRSCLQPLIHIDSLLATTAALAQLCRSQSLLAPSRKGPWLKVQRSHEPPRHRAARRPSQSAPFPRPLSSNHRLQRAIREFLKARTSYDVLPLSYRLIVFDTALLVKKSLNILIQNGAYIMPSHLPFLDLSG